MRACERSGLEGYAEKFVLSPNQSALANRSKAVKRQFKIERNDLQVLSANAGTEICDVPNSARLYAGFLAERLQRAFHDFRSTDRSALERTFPSVEIIKNVRYGAHPECLKTKPPGGICASSSTTVNPDGTISGAVRLSLSHDPATKLAR